MVTTDDRNPPPESPARQPEGEPVPFEAGQWVVCTKACAAVSNRREMKVGDMFQFDRYEGIGDKDVRLIGDAHWWFADRFRPATPAEVAEAERPKCTNADCSQCFPVNATGVDVVSEYAAARE